MNIYSINLQFVLHKQACAFLDENVDNGLFKVTNVKKYISDCKQEIEQKLYMIINGLKCYHRVAQQDRVITRLVK